MVAAFTCASSYRIMIPSKQDYDEFEEYPAYELNDEEVFPALSRSYENTDSILKIFEKIQESNMKLKEELAQAKSDLDMKLNIFTKELKAQKVAAVQIETGNEVETGFWKQIKKYSSIVMYFVGGILNFFGINI